MRYQLLGPIEVSQNDGTLVELTAPRERALLAVLLLNANRVVSASRLIDALWGDNPPLSASNALQVHVSKLRKKLMEGGPDGDVVKTAGGGYSINVRHGELDVQRFEHLLSDATNGKSSDASGLLNEALSLWRGPALSDVLSAELAGDAARLDELRLTAFERRVDADLTLGRHHDLVPELEGIVRQHPLREGLRAQLMLALYRSGRQAEALTVYRQGREVLAEQLGIDPSPALQALEVAILRQEPEIVAPRESGVLQPGAVDRTQGADLTESGRSPADLGHLTGHLPRHVSSFVGREAETAELRRLVAAEQLTTLVGPGGVGKTRLAVQIAQQVRDDWPGGVFFVDLASLRDPDLVATRLAEVVGIPEQPGRPTIDYVVDALESRRPLIVLDNCEQLLDACAALSDALLQRCPELSLLATSREPLGVEGERLFRLSPLATPEPTGREDLASIAEADAVRLFVDRGSLQRPDFRLEQTTAGSVAAICRALDGIPLALELAAARLRSMSVFEMEFRLADRFTLLTGGKRTASKRHQTLRFLIDWSYELLEPSEQAMLQRLSVFAGGWTLEIAEEVCGGSQLPRERIAEALGALVDKSLAEVESAGRVTRYRLLETIRQYAAERLSEGGDTPPVSASHARAYLSLAEQSAPMLRTSAQAEWLVRLDADLGNIRIASDTFRATADRDEDLLRLVSAQRWYWDIRGRYQEGIDLAQTALALAGPSQPIRLREETLLCLLFLKTWSGDWAGVGGHLKEALDLVRSSGDEVILSEVLAIGLYWRVVRGESGADLASMAQESIDCARRAGDRHTLGRVLAIASIGFGERNAIFAGCQEAVDIFRSIGDRHWLGVALNNLASVEMDADVVVQARAHLQEAVGIVTPFLGDSSMLAMLILNSGTLAVLQRDFTSAAKHFGESFGMAERVGSRSVRAISIMGRAWVASGTGEPRIAAYLQGLGDALLDEIGESLQPTEARLAKAARRKLRKVLGTEAYNQAYESGRDSAAAWQKTDPHARAAAVLSGA